MTDLSIFSVLNTVFPLLSGFFLSLIVWKFISFDFRFVIAFTGGIIFISLCMIVNHNIYDFLVYSLVFNIPFAIFSKTLFNHPEAMVDARGIDFGLTEVIIFASYFIWFCRIFISKLEPFPKIHKIDYFIILFILFQIISLFGAPNTILGVFQILYTIKFALIYFFIAHKVRYHHLKWILFLFLFAILLESSVSIYEVMTGNVGIGAGKGKASLIGTQFSVPGFNHLRAYGTTDSSHTLGLYYAMLLPVPLSLAMMNFLKIHFRIGALFIFTIGSVGLLLTFTRGGWLAFAIAASFQIVVITFIWKQGKVFFILLLFFFVLSFSFPKTYQLVYERFTNAPSELMSSRYNWNKTAISIWKNHFLFGCGTGNYIDCLDETDTKIFEIVNWPVHNIYLYIGSEMGIAGFLSFFSIVFIAFTCCFKLLKCNDMVTKALSLSILTALFAYLLYGTVNMMGRMLSVYYLFWVYIGLTVFLEANRHELHSNYL